jgi:hypothetical protein
MRFLVFKGGFKSVLSSWEYRLVERSQIPARNERLYGVYIALTWLHSVPETELRGQASKPHGPRRPTVTSISSPHFIRLPSNLGCRLRGHVFELKASGELFSAWFSPSGTWTSHTSASSPCLQSRDNR